LVYRNGNILILKFCKTGFVVDTPS